MPPHSEVQCQNCLDFWNPWGGGKWKVVVSDLKKNSHKGCRITPTSKSPKSKLFRFYKPYFPYQHNIHSSALVRMHWAMNQKWIGGLVILPLRVTQHGRHVVHKSTFIFNTWFSSVLQMVNKYMAYYRWHMTYDAWHVTRDLWHITGEGRWKPSVTISVL